MHGIFLAMQCCHIRSSIHDALPNRLINCMAIYRSSQQPPPPQSPQSPQSLSSRRPMESEGVDLFECKELPKVWVPVSEDGVPMFVCHEPPELDDEGVNEFKVVEEFFMESSFGTFMVTTFTMKDLSNVKRSKTSDGELDFTDPEFPANFLAYQKDLDVIKAVLMGLKSRAQETRARAVSEILDVKEGDPLAILLREVVDELVAGTVNKQIQDAYAALAYELPVDFAHEHVCKLFPRDYVFPLCFLGETNPLEYSPHTLVFPGIYYGFQDPCDIDSNHVDYFELLGKKDDTDGKLTKVHATYHRVARFIILLESLPPTANNAERFASLRSKIYQMIRECASVFCSKHCMGVPFYIKSWAMDDISRLEDKLGEMLELPNGDGYKMMSLEKEIKDIRMLICNTGEYFKNFGY